MNETSDTAGNAPPTAPAPRRLYRSVRDRRVAGVAGGLGAYTNIDPVVFRLGFVVLTFAGGAGLIAYLVGWLILPAEDGGGAPDETPAWLTRPEGVSTSALVVGGLLVAIGLATIIDAPGLDVIWPFSWPVVLVAVGLAVLIRSRHSRRGPDGDPLGASPPPPSPPPPPPPPPPAPLGGADDPITPALYEPTTPGLYEPDEVIETGLVSAGLVDDDGGDEAVDEEHDGEPDAPARPRTISATTLTIGVLFLAGGLATLGHLLDWWTLTAVGLMGGALLICGLGLVASAWLGRGLLLIPLGVLLAIGTIVAAIIDVPLRGGIGDRDYTVTDPADLQDEYRLAIGSLELDLSRLQLEEDARVEASVGLGDLVIALPDDVRVEVEAEAGMGQAVMEIGSERMRSDGGVAAEIVDSFDPALADETTPTLRLEARTGMGQIVIQQSGRGPRPGA